MQYARDHGLEDVNIQRGERIRLSEQRDEGHRFGWNRQHIPNVLIDMSKDTAEVNAWHRFGWNRSSAETVVRKMRQEMEMFESLETRPQDARMRR